MSDVRITLSATYQKRLGEIEDFIWESSGGSILPLAAFLSSHDSILEFLKLNPTTPVNHAQTGDQSWPFSDGRYRLFFKFNGKEIELLDLIDNRMSNLKIYPGNVLPTYSEEE